MKELKKIYVLDDEGDEIEWYVPIGTSGSEIATILNEDLGENGWMAFNEHK